MRISHSITLILLFIFVANCTAAETVDSGAKLSFTKLSGAAPMASTYQSHNQLVVANGGGIFVTYLDSDPAPQEVPRTNRWTLMRSIDQGKTFDVLIRVEGHATAPTVETDEDDNIYVFAPDNGASTAQRGVLRFYRFLKFNDYREPRVTSIPLGQYVDKFTAHYDRTRKQFYFFPYLNEPFLILDREGRVTRAVQLFVNGPNALLEYPHISMDDTRLFLAWTTATPVKPWRYYSIHCLFSNDGGSSWGISAPGDITLPIASDDTGPVTPVDTWAWLAGFTAFRGELHFMYLSGESERYRRLPTTDLSPTRAQRGTLESGNSRIQSLDGFFTVDRKRGVLYAIGADYSEQNAQGRVPIVVLSSQDNGENWRPYAKSGQVFRPYALGGARYSNDEHGITGIFTNIIGSGAASINEVFFFSVSI